MISLTRMAAVLSLVVCAVPALAEVQFAIGEPAEGSVKSGIGQISGWAVSDREIVSVEAFIDGASLGKVPYGGSRMDVASAFPDYPDAEHSGWAMKWNYSLHEAGEHLLTLVITEDDGSETRRDVLFYTTRFHSEFIRDPSAVRTKGSMVSSPAEGRLVVEGAEIDGEPVDIELQWDRASQQFLIDKVEYLGPAAEQNQKPSANAGPDQTVEVGQAVSLQGSGSDSDGWVANVSWSQVSGPAVSIDEPGQLTAAFVAPEQAGEVRLRLTVTDNGGLVDSDLVNITIVEPAPEPNNAPTADAGADFSVEQGDPVSITGSGSDSDGTIVGWSWSQVSGPSVSLSGAGSPQVQFTAPQVAGDIRLQLTVTDDDGASDSDYVTVTVAASSTPGNTTGQTLVSMLDDINEARGQAQDCDKNGNPYPPQPPLEWSPELADVALQHSMDMAEKGYFDHNSQDGTTFGDRVWPYWSGWTIGENIAASSINRPDSYVVLTLWMQSAGHCAAIMNPNFTHAGVGKAYDPDNGTELKYYWTLDFGG